MEKVMDVYFFKISEIGGSWDGRLTFTSTTVG